MTLCRKDLPPACEHQGPNLKKTRSVLPPSPLATQVAHLSSAEPLPELVLAAEQAWRQLHPWQRAQWAAKQAQASCAGWPGTRWLIEQRLAVCPSFYPAALKQNSLPALVYWLAQVQAFNPALGLGELLPDGSESHLLRLAGESAQAAVAGGSLPAGAARPIEGSASVGGSSLRPLLDSLLSADAGPPPVLISLEGVLPEVLGVAEHAARLARAAEGGAGGTGGTVGAGGGRQSPPPQQGSPGLLIYPPVQ